MSEHSAKIQWRHSGGVFEYDTYDRNHTWTLSNGRVIEASAAPSFLGDETRTDPEEALVATISSCHMLTFLAVAARKRLAVESYVDDAVGTLEKNERGKLAITRVILRPSVVFGGDPGPARSTVDRIHEIAHRECFIANSVRCDISIELSETDGSA